MTDEQKAAHAKACAESNAETALRNAVINGTADALALAGVPAERIEAARAWVAAERLAKAARKAAHVASGAEDGSPEDLAAKAGAS